MSKSTREGVQDLSRQSVELAIAAPQVIAHRLSRMAVAGAAPSESDQRETLRMVQEKQQAFSQSWIDMSLHLVAANSAFAWSFTQAVLWPKGGYWRESFELSEQLQRSSVDLVSKGLSPVHQKAVDNASRLASHG